MLCQQVVASATVSDLVTLSAATGCSQVLLSGAVMFGNVGIVKLLLLLATVLQQGHSQIQCPDPDQAVFCQSQCQATDCKDDGRCVDGACRCNTGFKKDARDRYKCDRIVCPDQDHTNYCQDQCQASGCTARGGGQCQQGECWCNRGFKREPWLSLYQCYEVKCPASVKEDQAYCQTQCSPLRTNGWCDVGGICRCNTGFKKEPRYSLYQCNEVKCPASVETDNRYCKTKCIPLCTNGTCGIRGVCNCNEGFKRPTESGYHCDQIICPSSVKEDYAHCETQCKARCKDGTCDSQGRCTCEEGFTEVPDKEYTCVTITCPSTVSKVGESRFCKRVCESQCLSGLCDDVGVCSCKDGFKKHRGASYNCVKILCPAWSSEDNEYCALQCKTSCTNGECNARGVCVCQEGFMATNITMNLDCQHKCNKNGSCPDIAIFGDLNCSSPDYDAINGSCEKRCNVHQDCLSGKPRCSTTGYCTSNEQYQEVCIGQCFAQCEQNCKNRKCDSSGVCLCENGSEYDGTCLTNCIRNMCAIQRDDGDAWKWVTPVIGYSAGVISLVIIIEVVCWVRRYRKESTRRRDIAKIESVELRCTQDPRKRELPVPGHFDTYLEPRCIAQQPEEQEGQYETVEELLPSVVAPAAMSVQHRNHSYLQMADLTDVPAAVTLYSNVAEARGENAYENFHDDKKMWMK